MFTLDTRCAIATIFMLYYLPSPMCRIYQSKLGKHGMAWLGRMLERFGHDYTTTANHAEPCWYCAGMVSSGGVKAVLLWSHANAPFAC